MRWLHFAAWNPPVRLSGILFSLEPVFAALFGFIFLQEILEPQGYIGAALVLCGVLISGMKKQEDFNRYSSDRWLCFDYVVLILRAVFL